MRFAVRYVHKVATSSRDTHPPIDLDESTLASKTTIAAALRASGVMMRGSRVTEFRVKRDDNGPTEIVVFPAMPGMTTYWHSIIMTREAS